MQQIQQVVRQAMVAGGQSVDRFNPEQAAVKTGIQLEFLATKLATISRGCITSYEKTSLEGLAKMLQEWSQAFKGGLHAGAHGRTDHAALIYADVNLMVASISAVNSTAKLPDLALAAAVTAIREEAHADYAPFVDYDVKD